MAQKIEWIRGRLVESERANELLNIIRQFLAVILQQQQPGGMFRDVF